MVKIGKNPGNGRLNNLNDPVLNVLKFTYTHKRKANKMYALFPLFVLVVLSSTCFEQTNSSSGGYFCTRSI